MVIEKAGEGNDRINSTVSYTLPANVEALWLVGTATINATDNDQGCSHWCNGKNNVLTAGAENDYLNGSAGEFTVPIHYLP